MRHILLICFLFTCLSSCALNSSQSITSGGIGLGSLIAVLASWSRNESILWAILHAFLGWIYVIYFVLTRKS